MKMNRNEVIVPEILNYCNQVEGTHKIFNDDEELFFSDENGYVYRNAISMLIFQIGELAKSLSEDFYAKHNLTALKQVARFRDVIEHNYENIEYYEVWKTSHDGIEELKNYLLSIQK